MKCWEKDEQKCYESEEMPKLNTQKKKKRKSKVTTEQNVNDYKSSVMQGRQDTSKSLLMTDQLLIPRVDLPVKR